MSALAGFDRVDNRASLKQDYEVRLSLASMDIDNIQIILYYGLCQSVALIGRFRRSI
jgi:hypothetical protein